MEEREGPIGRAGRERVRVLLELDDDQKCSIGDSVIGRIWTPSGVGN